MRVLLLMVVVGWSHALLPVDCSCNSTYNVNDTVVRVDNKTVGGPPVGTTGYVVCGDSGSELPLLVAWHAWNGGHSNTAPCACPSYTYPHLNTSGWWMQCRDVAATTPNGQCSSEECASSPIVLGCLTGYIRRDPYHNNADCAWRIDAPQGHSHIRLIVESMTGELSRTCSYDYIDIYDSPDRSGPRYRRCHHYATPVNSTGPHLFVHFHSDSSNTGSFSLRYEMCSSIDICPTEPVNLSCANGTISQQPYNNSERCSGWVIRQPGRIVEVLVEGLSGEIGRNCNFDYLSFYDGPSSSSPFIGHRCGTKRGPVRSTGDVMFIAFRSDSSITGSYRLYYHGVEPMPPTPTAPVGMYVGAQYSGCDVVPLRHLTTRMNEWSSAPNMTLQYFNMDDVQMRFRCVNNSQHQCQSTPGMVEVFYVREIRLPLSRCIATYVELFAAFDTYIEYLCPHDRYCQADLQ